MCGRSCVEGSGPRLQLLETPGVEERGAQTCSQGKKYGAVVWDHGGLHMLAAATMAGRIWRRTAFPVGL
eukprot:359971-Chlamydomonas_euryale.AAC.5